MTVTNISEYSKSKYKVFLNDAFAFVLYKGDLCKYGIKIGRELSDEEIEEIVSKVLVKRATLRAIHLLEKRDYTEKSLRDKLRESLYPENVIDAATDYVMSYHYVDDKRYAEAYINSHVSSMSRRQIFEKLLLKGVSEDIINTCLDDYLMQYGEVFDETLLNLMRKLSAGYDLKNISYNDRQKLFAKLYRKGYSVEQIEKAYRKCVDYE